MLVLTRRENESIMIGDNIVITIIEVDRGKVRVGISAPKDVRVDREEVRSKIKQANKSLTTEAKVHQPDNSKPN